MAYSFAETERLVIRPLRGEDIPALAAIWCDAEATRFMGGPRDFDKVCASFHEDLKAPVPSKLDLWPVVVKETGTIIGHCGLLPKEVDGCNEVELVYVIGSGFWGRGYATEAAAAIRDHAFNTLGQARLVALIDPENTASERVARKIGMRFEKETVRPSGKTMKVYAVERRV
jgi:ribosomal-protein-alanine N-acetyltransferase